MKKSKQEKVGQYDLAKTELYQILEKVDSDLAQKVREAGCLDCQGKLHRAKYECKPRGGPKEDTERKIYRESFCCDRDGCRKRHTPPSVRFLGRKVYMAVVVVLVSAIQHGLKPERVRLLRINLGQIDRRTLERWRAWWLETFVEPASPPPTELFRPNSDTVPGWPKNCPDKSRNPVRIQSESVSGLVWNGCPN